ncbi:unnamed protein product [Caenorhabditis auriculariae]|uniref:Uncharacterized protein n=1 Tax=Caenorhabditis auriculariae TaxID=2777116 RepID=A0A8S1H0W1_9PELO|nr:unnamed protein product [Caenorhabditis auriculariae]
MEVISRRETQQEREERVFEDASKPEDLFNKQRLQSERFFTVKRNKMASATVFAVLLSSFACTTSAPMHSEVASHTQDPKSNEEVSKILFGERGVLTGIFRMMDQQRKIQPPVANAQQDPSESSKIGKFDFKKIVDTLVMGTDKGELGDTGVELPEVLGICNRLSCGDIYKAIDKFRKSEMFSNFQTALTLVQDPNGWETIGKLLSNPELISQFTSGSGMEEFFGSALGEAKKESSQAKTKNSRLMPEDGDFGTDFSEDGEGESVGTGDKNAEIGFSVDKPTTEDYYGEVKKNGDTEDYEHVDVDVDVAPPEASSSTTVAPAKSFPVDIEEKLPPVSFSIDREEPEETETIEVVEQLPKITINRKIPSGNLKASGISSSQPKREEVAFRPTKISANLRPTTSKTTSKPSTTSTKPPTTTSTTTIKTTTAKNFRKDSDYYVMYYDENNN